MKRGRTTTTSNSMKRERIPTSLDFNLYTFQESASKKGKKSPTKVALEFLDHVEDSLNRRGWKTFHTFNLVVKFNRLVRDDGDFHVERWLNYAVNNGVKALHLSYHTNPNYKNGWQYVLPQSLYNASSLHTLDLFGCFFPQPRSDYGIGFSLKTLRLSRVCIDQETLQSLVEGCRFLEEFCMDLCEGFEVVRVGGEKLGVVDLYLDRDRVQTVVVAGAPRLRRLSYGGGFESVRGSFVASELGGVEELRFHDVSLEDGFLQQVMISNKFLKLELERCFMR